jgi:hypothetical protein
MRVGNIGFVLVTLAVLSGAGAAQAAEEAPPVIAIYTESFRRSSTHTGLQVIVALWADGRIVWSVSATNGSSPYREGKFSPEKLTNLLDRWAQKDAFTDKALARAWYGPEAAYTTIAIDDGQRRLKMRSWHEQFEQNTNLVALASGITPLQGRDRENLLRGEPAEYRKFRKVWSEVRQAVAGLVPQAGEPDTGPIQIEHR